MSNVVEDFYAAFRERDGVAMGHCYADDATFSDPVFPRLDAEQARAMWRMFCVPGGDLAVELASSEVTGDRGRARWIARYTFALTERPVVNVIDASFELREGRIVRHVDSFDLWKWSRQALGAPGILLGWSPIVRGRVRRLARARLDAFMEKEKRGAAAPP